jgi:PAS domain S-box-containing protein
MSASMWKSKGMPNFLVRLAGQPHTSFRMAEAIDPPPELLEEDAAIRRIFEGTATQTGERFFQALVENLAGVMGTHGAWVTEYLPERRTLRAHAFWLGGIFVEDYEQVIDGTPCEAVIEEARLVHYPDRVIELFPKVPDIRRIGVVSYMGVPLLDLEGKILGHLAVLDIRPLPLEPRGLAIFRIFAARAAAELGRLRAEARARERGEQLERLIGSAMDAIVEIDGDLGVRLMNPAAEKAFGWASSEARGRHFAAFLAEGSPSKLDRVIAELSARPEGDQSLWIPGGLRARSRPGREFPAEATISLSRRRDEIFYTLILRNVDERVEAERKIRALTAETEYLREEVRSHHLFDEIIGTSEPLLRALRDVERVAPTGATVLILGETGTGKDVVARAIHARSGRKGGPLVKVNCAAIPSSLMESEFFGHERGAFTGATGRREGRFALADGGSIFLDEVADLPLDLQGKLLRVLQDGEFEPVGSSTTRKVDVRVLAATNRDLARAVKEGGFREDLYYRLEVFPIRLPPLRERGDDVALLAEAFIGRIARRLGRKFEPLSERSLSCLKRHSWPGNVRELQNVLERAAIISIDGRLDLDRSLPPTGPGTAAGPSSAPTAVEGGAGRIRTFRELEDLERANILRAMRPRGGRSRGRMALPRPSASIHPRSTPGCARSASGVPGREGQEEKERCDVPRPACTAGSRSLPASPPWRERRPSRVAPRARSRRRSSTGRRNPGPRGASR